MAEDVKPEAIKKTQAALAKFIKKPPLTDKLLKKPPFRFLHDIVTSVIKETGFLEGVFTADELIADNVKDRDSKVKFLTKLINAVKQATGTAIKAKPGKIVAGLEADKTLELLQAIAKGITANANNKKNAKGNQEDKKKSEPAEKKSVKPKLKDSSPANSLEKQPSTEGKDGGVETGSKDVIKNKTSGGSEETRKEKTRDGSGTRREGSTVREGSATKENGIIADTEVGDGKHVTNGDVGDDAKKKLDESRRSGRRRSSAITKETVEALTVEDDKKTSSKEVEENKRPSSRRRESSAGKEAAAEETNAERRSSSRRRDSSASRTAKEEPAEDGKLETDKRSARRRSSAGLTELKPAEERLVNGHGPPDGLSPPESGDSAVQRRRATLRKSTATAGSGGESLEKPSDQPETAGDGATVQQKRPQTKRASSRSSRGPLKAFADKDKTADLKEEDDEDVKKKKTDKAPITLGSSEEARPPTAQERPRTARRAPPSARPASGRPPTARSSRPPSARPGAVRARDRGEVDVDISKEDGNNEVKEVVVITENDKADDKEDMVVVEKPSLQITEVETVGNDTPTGAEGALVDSILESQSELEKRKSSRAQVDIEWEGGRKVGGSGWEREAKRLREGVQGLTRAAGPLGKLLDFLQEDVDLASRELGHWRREAATFARQLAAEQRLTDETLARHRSKLTELDGLIEEQQEAIRGLKSSILTNDRKIQAHISRFPAR